MLTFLAGAAAGFFAGAAAVVVLIDWAAKVCDKTEGDDHGQDWWDYQ